LHLCRFQVPPNRPLVCIARIRALALGSELAVPRQLWNRISQSESRAKPTTNQRQQQRTRSYHLRERTSTATDGRGYRPTKTIDYGRLQSVGLQYHKLFLVMKNQHHEPRHVEQATRATYGHPRHWAATGDRRPATAVSGVPGTVRVPYNRTGTVVPDYEGRKQTEIGEVTVVWMD
jgi:hypothetical protein